MNTTEAVEYLTKKHGLKTTRGTLNKLACIGGGPAFQKFGHKRLYTAESLNEWVCEKLSPPVRSTSELRTNAA